MLRLRLKFKLKLNGDLQRSATSPRICSRRVDTKDFIFKISTPSRGHRSTAVKMLATAAPTSAFGRPSSLPRGSRPISKDGEQQQIWIPMLNSASKGKDLTEKHLILLGGSPDQQREFLEHLNPENTRSRFNSSNNTKAKISNRYTLGYTYHDVQDADGEGTLARLNVHLLSNPSGAFAPLLKPLLTAKTVKDTLIVILLDWSDPYKWARQLRQWIRLLRSVILTLDDETKIAMEENISAWKEKRIGPDAPSHQTSLESETKTSTATSLGPGEWDEQLGLPLSVICIQSEKIEGLERDQGWQDEHFDFLVQWLRCVLLKHGSSLVYTSTSDPNNVRTLLHSSLSILSLLKRDVAKPNYMERDKILIPPNWDSWGKIRPLREGTDLEAISDAWAIEIQAKPDQNPDAQTQSESEEGSAVSLYESTLPNPTTQPSIQTQPVTDDVMESAPSVQDFLSQQLKVLDGLKEEDEKIARKQRKDGSSTSSTGTDQTPNRSINPRMTEQIGPYQINVNGIDFDAEEATRRIKERENERTANAATATKESRGTATGSGVSTPTSRRTGAGPLDDKNTSNEAMSAFFANLIQKKDKRAAGSGAVSPNRGSPAPERRLE
jgi:dynein light intermediate chain 1, cytosolic